ncbi:MAG: T9SS type A sorting domain-containing protein, partial [Bacteroides sp.]
GQFIKAVIKPKASAPGDFYLKELEVLAKANSKNTLEIAHFATAKISAGKTLNKEIEYSLGGAVMADNIEAKVVSNNEQVVLVKNVLLNKNTNKIEFTLEGVVKGKARVMISLKNGDWSYHSGVDVQILDLGNLAQGKKVTANPAGIGGITGTLSVITDGIIPPAGVNGNTEWGKYWVSQDAGRLKTAVIVDLEENYLVNGIKLFTTTTQYVADYLAGLEAYVGKEDNAASYKKVDMPFYSYQTEYTAAINPAVEGRYVKLILENGDNYQGVAVREIEVSGSVIEPPVNITKINVPTTLIYPNPIVQGETLNVKVDNAKVIKLVTIQGNIVSETNAQPEVTSISTGGIQRGVYLLIVETENGNKVEKITII